MSNVLIPLKCIATHRIDLGQEQIVTLPDETDKVGQYLQELIDNDKCLESGPYLENYNVNGHDGVVNTNVNDLYIF